MKQMSEKQRKACSHKAGPAMVLSGAGSGKTRVLCGRHRYLQETVGVDGDQIVLLAPNPGAAVEMQRWLTANIPEKNGASFRTSVDTFQSFCARLLRPEIDALGFRGNFVIYDEEDRHSLIRSILKELKIHEALFRGIAARISNLKAAMVSTEDFLAGGGGFGFEEKLARVYVRYQDELTKNNSLDEEDLVCYCVRLLEENPKILRKIQQGLRHLLVDDFQDITPAQYRLVRLLGTEGVDVFVAADDDQAILGFRGARQEFIQRFSGDFPKVKTYRLERSYRCTPCILGAADAIVRENSGRLQKKIRSDRNEGQKPRYFHGGNEVEEATYLVSSIQELYYTGRYEYSEFVILYRMSSQIRPLEEALRLEGVPFRVTSNRALFRRPEVRDALAYARALFNQADSVSLKRIVNCPPRGMGESTLAKMQEMARKEGEPFVTILKNAAKTRKSLAKVKKLLDLFSRLGRKASDAKIVMREALEKSGYLAWLAEEKNGAEKLKNVDILIEMGSGKSLGEFLDDVVLFQRTRMSEESEQPAQAVHVMTVYEAQGLEFPVVFMPGLEEGVLPRVSSGQEDAAQLEEERRLLYVGMTRARDLLYLSGAARRRVYSRIQPQKPSRFLKDLPSAVCSVVERAPASVESVETPSRSQASSPDATLTVGARVRHVTWGAGVVRDFAGQGDAAKVTVNFPGVGIKRLALKFANLEMV